MDETLSEKEQIEMIRAWWKENGTYVMAGIVLGVAGILGFNQWRTGQVELQTEASTLFEQLAEEIADNSVEPAEVLASEMYADYAETIYADQTRLAMARLYMDQGRDDDAATALRELLDAAERDQDMQLIARLRLAKVLLYQGKPEEVLTLLDGYGETGMGARFNVAIGDAHYELGQYAEAEEAYMAALADPNALQLIDSSLVQMKINDLPVVLPEGGSTTPEPETTDTDAAEEPDVMEAEPDAGIADEDSGAEESVE